MTFKDFLGNRRAVETLRCMLAARRIPPALLFAGPAGVGKYTLGTLLARALNCVAQKNDVCGACASCRELEPLEDLRALRDAALRERGRAEADRVPLILRLPRAPEVVVLVPDPKELGEGEAKYPFIRAAQVDWLHSLLRFLPSEKAAYRIVLLDDADRLHHEAADRLLKMMEEAAERTLFLLVTSLPYQLRPTIRSRCIPLHFSPLAPDDIQACLARRRPELTEKQRALVAAAVAGSLGTALTLNLENYLETRHEALVLLETAAGAGSGPERFFAAAAALAGKAPRGAEETGSAAEGFAFALDVLYSLLSDVVVLKYGSEGAGLRNPDLRDTLERIGGRVTWPWPERALAQLDALTQGRRRNINRQLALEAFSFSLTEADERRPVTERP